MRILLLSHYALPHTGGIEAVVDALARRFVSEGHSVTHVASSAVRPGEPAADSAELPYGRMLLSAINTLEVRTGIPYPFFGPRLLSGLWSEVGAADVVHAHGLLYQPSVAAAVIGGLRKKPIVMTEHVGHVPYTSGLARATQSCAFATLGRLTLSLSSHLIVLNGRVETEIRSLNRGTRVVRLGNGVDTERYHPAGEGERQALRAALGWPRVHRLLLVGRLVEKKGIAEAIASAEILGSDYGLTLVGPGEVKRPLPVNVTVAGPQLPEKVAEMYRAADALILPSRGEGFPLAVQEALASGLPVFVPADGDFVDVLRGAEPAVQWITADPQSIAACVAAFFAQPSVRASTAAAAVSFARERFGWDAVVRRHLEIYREAIDERAAGDDD